MSNTITDTDIKIKSMFILGNDYSLLDDTTKDKIDILYESSVIKALTKYRWGFCRETTELIGQELNNNKYKYSFTLPEDFLTLINVYDDLKETSINNDYELTTILRANREKIYLKYIKRVDTSLFPSTFIEYLIYELACELCFNLTGDYNLLQLLETKKQEKYEIACNIDARQRKPYNFLHNPFNDVRN